MCGGNGAVGVDHAAARMRDHDPARQEMQAVLEAAGQFPIFLVEIFGIADDGMIDMRHMRPQLMGAPGDRLQRDPRRVFCAEVSTTA